jgi:hypothetical protein
MQTDRDIVVKVLAEGRDPSQTGAGDLGQGKPVTIGADDSAQLALRSPSTRSAGCRSSMVRRWSVS